MCLVSAADGVNIDNWTFEALTLAVEHFARSQQPGYVEAEDHILQQQLESERAEQAQAQQQAQEQAQEDL